MKMKYTMKQVFLAAAIAIAVMLLLQSVILTTDNVSEAKGKTMAQIAGIADKRMYEAKSKHYKQKGIERRRT